MCLVCLYKEENFNTDRHTEGRQPCKGGGRDGSDSATSQGTPGAPRSWKRQVSPRDFGETMALKHLYFGLLDPDCENTNVCCFKPPSPRKCSHPRGTGPSAQEARDTQVKWTSSALLLPPGSLGLFSLDLAHPRPKATPTITTAANTNCVLFSLLNAILNA